jgi:vitamin B12 transporter
MLARSNRNRKLVLGPMLAALAGGTAQGQVVEIPQLIIYANQAATEASKVGSAVTLITDQEIKDRGFPTVAEALRTVPGVAVSQTGGRGSFTQVRIRGAEANHLQVLIDGVQVNDISDGDFNFADLAVENIERIEVIRGPQSGLYGANAQAGVIAIVTKSGRGLKRPEVDTKLEGGSRSTFTESAIARGAVGQFYGAVGLVNTSTAGYNISRFGSERDGSRSFTLTSKVGVDITPDLNVEGSLRHVDRFNRFDSQPFFGPFEGLAFDSAFDFNAFKTTTGRIAATWAAFDGAFVQRFAASRFEQKRNDDDVVLGFFRSEGHRDNFDYKGTVRADTNVLGGERHTLTGAVDRQTEFLKIDSASFFFDPAAAAFWANGARRDRTGVAGEYALDLVSGLSVTGAARHDWNSGFADATTWRVTAAQRIASTGTKLHASAGTGITNPTFIEQFGFFVGTFRGNPALRPEQSLGWDAGIEQRFLDGQLITDVTYFASDFEDKIILVTGTDTISTAVNAVGISPRRGVETTAKVIPVDWLLLTGTYTYTDARLPDGTPEIRRPRHTAAGSATAKFADGRAKATVNFVYNGAMPDLWFRFPIVPVTLNSYTTVSGIISYDLSPQVAVYLRGENVFDAKYEEVFSHRAPGAAIYAGLRGRIGGE